MFPASEAAELSIITFMSMARRRKTPITWREADMQLRNYVTLGAEGSVFPSAKRLGRWY
jgi:hypothetical protein